MEDLTRYDVAEYNGVLMVVVESEFLPPDPSVVVVPLLRDYPAVRHLNPEIDYNEQKFVLATRLVAAVRRANLKNSGNVSDQHDKITRAIDVLMSGF